MSNWVRSPLGEHLALDIEPVDVASSTDYPIVGVLGWGRGLLSRPSIVGWQTSYRTLHRVRPGRVIYSKLKAFEGAITVVPASMDVAFASPEFPTFAFRDTLLPEYFSLLTTEPSTWASMRSASKGMGGRRERMNPSDFLRLEFDIPPLGVQRRIVEVVGAVDDQIAALTAEAVAAKAMRTPLIDDALGRSNAAHVALGSVGEVIRGRRFTKSDYVESGLGCIHYGQIYTDYEAVATETVTYLSTEMKPSMRLARTGDLVVAGTSENVDDVCKAVAWMGPQEVAVHDDCFIFRHSLDPRFAAYLFASSAFQHGKLEFVSETKVVRVAGASLARIKVPVPEAEIQRRISDIIGALDTQIAATRTEAARLRAVRTSLLSALLNREIEINQAEAEVA